MKLRDFQSTAVEKVYEAWTKSASTIGVAATGLGKTVILGHVIKNLNGGRAMIIAHREELIWQAAEKIERILGVKPDIEMAEYRADRHLFSRSPVVISTVQTLMAGQGEGRIGRFKPEDFSCLVIDECHHSTANSYKWIIQHFRKNKDLRVVGFTATPDRTDEEALGQVFDSVAFEYDVQFGISNGWLVPVNQFFVPVNGLDLSTVRTTAGDLNAGDLSNILEQEKPLHEFASPTVDIVGDRKTLVFAASLAHAERFCEILNRHKSDCARWVSGKTPKEDRRAMFADYAHKRFQFLVNVGVASEGFDDPGIEVVVMARPTKSRSLYAQMIGRGTRPLPGTVDQYEDPADRRMAITESNKPFIEVIDFVGNSGKHKLIGVADILGGNYSDAIVERAARNAKESGKSMDMVQALEDAAREDHEERERQKKIEASRRSELRVRATYSREAVDPFDVFQIQPPRERGWDAGKPITDKMRNLLERQGIETEHLSFSQARQLIIEVTGRWDSGKCSYKQAKWISQYGFSSDCSRQDATRIIEDIKAGKIKRPAPVAQVIDF